MALETWISIPWNREIRLKWIRRKDTGWRNKEIKSFFRKCGWIRNEKNTWQWTQIEGLGRDWKDKRKTWNQWGSKAKHEITWECIKNTDYFCKDKVRNWVNTDVLIWRPGNSFKSLAQGSFLLVLLPLWQRISKPPPATRIRVSFLNFFLINLTLKWKLKKKRKEREGEDDLSFTSDKKCDDTCTHISKPSKDARRQGPCWAPAKGWRIHTPWAANAVPSPGSSGPVFLCMESKGSRVWLSPCVAPTATQGRLTHSEVWMSHMKAGRARRRALTQPSWGCILLNKSGQLQSLSWYQN